MDYSETAQPGNGANGHTVLPYKFEDAYRLSERQLKRLGDLNRHFSQDLADTLSILTRKRVTANSSSLEQVDLLDVREQIPDMPLRFLLEMQPLGIRAFLGLDSELTFSLLQAFLGAKTASATAPPRDLTEVELSVLRDIDRVVVQDMEKTWRMEGGLDLVLNPQRTTSRPEDLALFHGKLLFAVLEFSLDSRPAKIVLAYPIQVSEGLPDAPSDPDDGRPATQSEATQKTLFGRVRSSQIVVEGCLQDSSVHLSDLLDLRAGDLLRLDLPLSRPIDVRLNGERRFQADFLETNVKKSLRIQNTFPR